MEPKRLRTARFLARCEARERLNLLALERAALLQQYPELRDLDREIGQTRINCIDRRSPRSLPKARQSSHS